MDFLGKARKLESRISRTLDVAVEGFVGRSPRQPIEVVQAIVDYAEQQVQPAGRGRRLFPFNQLIVHVVAASRPERARFAAVIEGPPSLQQRLTQRLSAAGCHVPPLDVQVAYVSKAKPGWRALEYHVAFDRIETAAPMEETETAAAPTEPARLDLNVIAGMAERRTYTFTGGRIDIGRRAEVLDQHQRLIRRNHIAFVEGDADANRSVSRRHAHIAFIAPSREYRLRDDGSARGTAVLRNGRTIRVPEGARGIRLESGDEIALGEARLKVRIK
jgi:FHA domain-containing protein